MNRNPASSASVAAALEDDLVVAKERKKRDKNALDYKRAREIDKKASKGKSEISPTEWNGSKHVMRTLLLLLRTFIYDVRTGKKEKWGSIPN